MVMLAACGGGPAILTATPDTVAFDMVVVGDAGADTAIAIANTGGSATGVLALSVGDPAFALSTSDCYGALGAGESCMVAVHFAPLVPGPVASLLEIDAGMGQLATVALSATALAPAAFAITPPTVDFGSVATGEMSASTELTIANTGDVATGTPTVSGMGDVVDFAIESSTCTAALAPGDTCTTSLTFAPTSSGVKTAMLVAAATPGGNASATVTGNGVMLEPLLISPAFYDFGGVPVGTNASPFTFTITNPNGITSQTINALVSGADAASFAVSNACTTLAPAMSCTVAATFLPTVAGSYTASLVVDGVSASLTGTGTTTGTASLGASPASRDFGYLPPGMGMPTTFTITNTGTVTADTLVAALRGTNPDQFAIGASSCTGSLAGGASCTIDVAPAPTSVGTKAATLTVSSPEGSVDVALTEGCCASP